MKEGPSFNFERLEYSSGYRKTSLIFLGSSLPDPSSYRSCFSNCQVWYRPGQSTRPSFQIDSDRRTGCRSFKKNQGRPASFVYTGARHHRYQGYPKGQ